MKEMKFCSLRHCSTTVSTVTFMNSYVNLILCGNAGVVKELSLERNSEEKLG